MPVRRFFFLIIVLLIFFYLDRDIELWSTKTNEGRVFVSTQGIINYTAELNVVNKEGKKKAISLFRYADSPLDWGYYVKNLYFDSSENSLTIHFHGHLFASYSKDAFLLEDRVNELNLNGLLVKFVYPTNEEVKSWESSD